MDYCTRNFMWVAILLIAELSIVTASWQKEWAANYVSRDPVSSPLWGFESQEEEMDSLKLLLVDEDMAFIGGRNMVYYISLTDPDKELVTLEWKADTVATKTCEGKGMKRCHNYIRVLLRKGPNLFYICGTNAYQPQCRQYKLENNRFVMEPGTSETGTGICPFDPFHNSTILHDKDGNIFSATVSDSYARDPLILLKSKKKELIRTKYKDSMFLNDPDFVSSFEKDDKILFFFRETAIEYINCGKAVFSRVGRICKQDRGAVFGENKNKFTSFFKARLNCSIPGEFPFYFDEIQSTTDFGQGNYKPTTDSGDRSDMIYGIFNTPENSITGSAVCAFQYSDIANTFRGRFKGEASHLHKWLPVSWEETPITHPEKCTNSRAISHESYKFSMIHPLMNEAVPARGGQPMLVHTSFNSRFTQIAVDWQVLAADGFYYDVMFVGTDDGRVIKAINKGPGKVDTVTIEDIQVMEKGEAVTSLKVISDRMHKAHEKLLVMSKNRMLAIPLHRCGKAKTCKSCVAMQDPYCAWNTEMDQCISAEAGIQSIKTGEHSSCPTDEVTEKIVTTEPTVGSECKCPSVGVEEPSVVVDSVDTDGVDEIVDRKDKKNKGDFKTSEEQIGEPSVGASSQKCVESAGISLDIFVIIIVVSIIFFLVLGFFIGFKFQSCRYARDQDVFYDQHSRSLQRGMGRNRLSSGDNPYFHTEHTSLAPKKLNHVVNVKNGKSNTQTLPVTKSNKVYL